MGGLCACTRKADISESGAQQGELMVLAGRLWVGHGLRFDATVELNSVGVDVRKMKRQRCEQKEIGALCLSCNGNVQLRRTKRPRLQRGHYDSGYAGVRAAARHRGGRGELVHVG